MRTRLGIVALSVITMTLTAASPGLPGADVFTPLTVAAFTPRTIAFPGTDGRTHIVYELLLTNTNITPATIESVEVVDAANPSKTLDTYDDKKLLTALRTTGNSAVETPVIEFNGTRLLMFSLALNPGAAIPKKLMHRVKYQGATSPSPKPATPAEVTYTAAPIEIETKFPHIGAPLSGAGWVAINGCCEVGVHRASSIACNGGLYLSQRFAIDWMQLDKDGKLISGDASDVHAYAGYGAQVLAVADGTVVGIEDSLEDQKPPTLPDPSTITINTIDGNHIVLDLGGGVYAFYAHLQKGSLAVKLGDRVKRSQVLAKLGNTGNSSAPHLHFHLMQSPSVLCSNGIPYAIDTFAAAGNLSSNPAAEQELTSDFSKALRPANTRRYQYPLDAEIVNFASPH
jgi:hypothetical protein